MLHDNGRLETTAQVKLTEHNINYEYIKQRIYKDAL